MILSTLLETPTDVPVDLPLTWGLLVVIAGVASSTAFLTWFVRSQFSNQQRMFYRIISRHNREDDDRFAALSDEMWNIRLHLAGQSGQPLPPRTSFPRRTYLVDGGNQTSDDK